MEFEWDAAKDAINIAKHGISLAEAAALDWANAFREQDTRRTYGEVRYRALAPLGARIQVCVYTLRVGVYRVISLRRANYREVRRYEQQKSDGRIWCSGQGKSGMDGPEFPVGRQAEGFRGE